MNAAELLSNAMSNQPIKPPAVNPGAVNRPGIFNMGRMKMELTVEPAVAAKVRSSHANHVSGAPRRRPSPQERADNRINKSGGKLIDRNDQLTNDINSQGRRVIDDTLDDGLNQLKQQAALQKVEQFITMISTYLKKAHDITMSVINNMR